MDNLDKYIDQLFQEKLSGTSLPESLTGAEWPKLTRSIRRKNFMRFNPSRFNIFYLVASVGIMAVMGATFFPQLINKPETLRSSIKHIAPTADSSEINDSAQLNGITFIPANKANETSVKSLLKKDCRVEEPMTVSVEPKLENLNSDSISEISNESSEKLSLHESENQTAVIPDNNLVADTLIKVDTVKVIRKGIYIKRRK